MVLRTRRSLWMLSLRRVIILFFEWLVVVLEMQDHVMNLRNRLLLHNIFTDQAVNCSEMSKILEPRLNLIHVPFGLAFLSNYMSDRCNGIRDDI